MFDFIRRALNVDKPAERSDSSSNSSWMTSGELRDFSQGLRSAMTPHQAELDAISRSQRAMLGGARGPVDRELVMHTMRQLYEKASLASPDFVWLDTPDEGFIAAAIAITDRSFMEFPAHARRKSLAAGLRRELYKFEPKPGYENLLLRPREELLPGIEEQFSSLRSSCGLLADTVYDRAAVNAYHSPYQYALDIWLNQYLCVEQQLENSRSPMLTQWRDRGSLLWYLPEAEHRQVLSRLIQEYNHPMGGWWGENSWDSPTIAGPLEIMIGANLAAIEAAGFGTAINKELAEALARHCSWCWPFEGLCIMTDRPQELFSLDELRKEENVEVRRVMIEWYGMENYLRDAQAKLIHADECGQLYRLEQDGDEAIVVVKVINCTAEPDGSFREYFLRVPPDMKRAKQAVAWTFGMTENEYAPARET